MAASVLLKVKDWLVRNYGGNIFEKSQHGGPISHGVRPDGNKPSFLAMLENAVPPRGTTAIED